MKHNCISNIEEARITGKRIGFTASSFDLLHPGHILMLAEAKSQCDYLVVGLLTDPTISRPDTKNKPAQSTFERFIQIQAVDYIDELIPFDSEYDLEQMIKIVKPDIRFCGVEYKGTKHTGYDIPGVEHCYNRRDHDYSTTGLRNRIVNIFIQNTECTSAFDKDTIRYKNESYKLITNYSDIINNSKTIKIVNRTISFIGKFNKEHNSMFEQYTINTGDIEGFIPFEDNPKNFMGERLVYQIITDVVQPTTEQPEMDVNSLVTVDFTGKKQIIVDCMTGKFTFLGKTYEIDFDATYHKFPKKNEYIDYIALITKPTSDTCTITPLSTFELRKVSVSDTGIISWAETIYITDIDKNYRYVLKFDDTAGNIGELLKEWEKQNININIPLHGDSYVLLYKHIE